MNDTLTQRPITPEQTLFKVKARFLQRRRQKSDPSVGGKAFVQGLNKFTFGGYEKVSSGIDKLKDFVTQAEGLSMKKKKGKTKLDFVISDYSKGDELQSDADTSDYLTKSATSLFPGEINSSNTKKPDETTCDPAAMVPLTISINGDPLGYAPSEISVDSTQPSPVTTLEPIRIPLSARDVTWDDGFTALQNVLSVVWKLHREAKNGPLKLGPINTTLYDRYHLDENLLELLQEILELKGKYLWIYVQLQYFLKPILYALGGHIINR